MPRSRQLTLFASPDALIRAVELLLLRQNLVGGRKMLTWVIIFLVLALIAALFGFGGIAAGAAGIAKILFYIFLVIFVVMLIISLVNR